MNKQPPHQTVQLGHGTFAAGLANVPDFDTAFATRVDMACGVANCDSAHHLAMAQCVDLTRVARNTRANQGIGWEGNRLHLTICADVEGVITVGNDGAVLVFNIYTSKSIYIYSFGDTLTVYHQKWM